MRGIILAAAMLGVAAVALGAHASAQSTQIPEWVKETAEYWADGQVSDSEFVAALEYLIGRGVINIPGSGETVDAITIGFIPVEKAEALTPRAGALKSFLEERMPGTTVEIVVPTNYETIIEGMRFGHIDAAFMDTGPAWITHQRTGAEAILAEVVDGKISYQATVWVMADDDSINSLEETLGKRVAFTSITGSSGFVRPMGSLVTSGSVDITGDDIIALERALADSFEAHTFAGGYKAALELLLNGNVDAAFGSDVAPQKYLEPEDAARLRPAGTVGTVPSHVFMVSAEMPEQTREALAGSLVQLNREENNHILADLYGAEALLPTTTAMHIGDFGTYIDALVGLDQLILEKYDKAK